MTIASGEALVCFASWMAAIAAGIALVDVLLAYRMPDDPRLRSTGRLLGMILLASSALAVETYQRRRSDAETPSLVQYQADRQLLAATPPARFGSFGLAVLLAAGAGLHGLRGRLASGERGEGSRSQQSRAGRLAFLVGPLRDVAALAAIVLAWELARLATPLAQGLGPGRVWISTQLFVSSLAMGCAVWLDRTPGARDCLSDFLVCLCGLQIALAAVYLAILGVPGPASRGPGLLIPVVVIPLGCLVPTILLGFRGSAVAVLATVLVCVGGLALRLALLTTPAALLVTP